MLLVVCLAALASAEEGKGIGGEGKAPPDGSAAAKAAAAAKIPAVSTSPISIGSSIEEVYAGATMRDPFVAVAGGAKPSAAAAGSNEPPIPAGTVPSDEFSIHSLELKGVMEDRAGGLAILVDPKFGASFVLRRGRLFDVRNKPVPGVTGSVKAKQKSVMLIGPDHDKRVLTMAEKEDNDDKGKAEAPAAAASNPAPTQGKMQ